MHRAVLASVFAVTLPFSGIALAAPGSSGSVPAHCTDGRGNDAANSANCPGSKNYKGPCNVSPSTVEQKKCTTGT